MLRVCLVLVMVCVFGAGHLSGRGLFCRDPETGKLHPVNSTWTSSSFCGTYHCKVRRKNITSTMYAPMRQINVTDIRLQLLGDNATTVDVKKEDTIVKKEEIMKDTHSTDNKTIPFKTNDDSSQKIQGINQNDDIDEKNASDKDRYLSDKEIRSLTDILHTVKKGDLDAIVEIYNLAQDIYKELDQTSTDLILQDALSTPKTSEQQIVQSKTFKKVTQKDSASYWYEPLSNTKIRVADLSTPDIIRNYVNPEIPAMVISIKAPVANIADVTAKPTKKNLLPPLPAVKPAKPNIVKGNDDFFNIPLSHKDFGKLPYYYPMSNFQRVASYKHDQKKSLLDNTRTQALTMAPILTTTLASTTTRIPKHISAWIPEPMPPQAQVQIPEPAPAWISDSLPPQAQVQVPETVPAWISDSLPPQAQVQIPEPVPAWISEALPAQTQAEISKSITAQIKKSMPVHTQVRNPARLPETIPEKTQARIPARMPARIPGPIPVRIPSRIPVRIPVPIPIRIPVPVPVKIPPKASTPAPAPAPAKEPAHKSLKNKPMNTGMKYVKELKPSIYLPYPFTSIQQRNWSLMHSLYNGHHFGPSDTQRTDVNTFKNIKMITEDEKNNEIPSINRLKEKQDNVVLMNPDLENFQDLQIKASRTSKNSVVATNNEPKEERRVPERRKPAWQTDPLPEHILDEVRAHIQDKHRTFIHTVPFRKKVKLERVGNLFNMDQLTRTKREAEDKNTTTATPEVQLEPEIFEVFIDKTTCESDYSVPGYFRFGNLSEPYPECCPQRIPVR